MEDHVLTILVLSRVHARKVLQGGIVKMVTAKIFQLCIFSGRHLLNLKYK
jgi:hypothetical protein